MLSLNPNKALPLIFLPLGLSSLLLAAALRWPRRILIAAPLLIVGILGAPVFADRLMRSLEDRYPYRSIAECPQADAAFVFGGMLGPRDRPDGSIAWNEAAERFDCAIRIMQARKAGTLVFSGGPMRYQGGSDEGELLKQEALARGVPEHALLVTGATMNTKSEATDICELAARMHWRRVLLVTSAYHMPRAMRLTDQCAAERIPVPIAYRTPDPRTSWAQSRVEYYMPQARGLLTSEVALHEYFGMLFYASVDGK
jgi:uncharacterized SAM-binding protein YcdF (DUF218 family)